MAHENRRSTDEIRQKTTCLLAGRVQLPEFREVHAWITQHFEAKYCSTALSAFNTITQTRTPPELLLIAQCRFGEISQELIDRLRQHAPLTRVILLQGPWCEGEPQSGQRLEGVERCYWHQAIAYLDQQLDSIQHRRCPAWGLPDTLSLEEKVRTETCEPITRQNGLIVIQSNQPEAEHWLTGLVASAGFSTAQLTPGEERNAHRMIAGVWEGETECPRQIAALAQFCELLAPAPVIALVNFLRSQDREALRDAGAHSVLSKPFRNEDLFWHLNEIVGVTFNSAEPEKLTQ